MVETYTERGTAMGVVDFGGVTKQVCLAFTPEVGVGDYTIVHAGLAIAVVDERAAAEALALFDEMGDGAP